MTGEFDLIARYFAPLASDYADKLTDDCAHIPLGDGTTLLVSKDISIEGVHFPKGCPVNIAVQRALGSAFSDIPASGGLAFGYMLGVTLPKTADVTTITAEISDTLASLQADWTVTLLGGDTVVGDQFALSVTVFGRSKMAIKRSGAATGDAVFVTGTIGDAAAALPYVLHEDQKGQVAENTVNQLTQRYEKPEPRLGIADLLSEHASAAIDISDGLAADAAHIATASCVGIEIEAGRIPVSSALLAAVEDAEERYHLQLTGGDDYEILFTAPQAAVQKVLSASTDDIGITLIGRVVDGQSSIIMPDGTNRPLSDFAGYDHLSSG